MDTFLSEGISSRMNEFEDIEFYFESSLRNNSGTKEIKIWKSCVTRVRNGIFQVYDNRAKNRFETDLTSKLERPFACYNPSKK